MASDGLANAAAQTGQIAALSLLGLSKIAATPAERTEILVDFISNSESDLSDLRAAQIVPDLPACARIAHRMIGSSRMIGAIELAEVCENMERAARQGSAEDVMRRTPAMDGALGRLDAHWPRQDVSSPSRRDRRR